MSLQRVKMTTYPLESLPTLIGKRLEFNSMAELISTRAHEIPDQPYVLYYDQTITYAQMNSRANQVAAFLKEQGVGKGDVVSFMILNSPEIYYCMFGTQKLGAVSGGINFMLKGPEIAHILEDSRPKVVFVGSQFIGDFYAGYEISSHKPLVIEAMAETGKSSGAELTTLDQILQEYPTDEILADILPDDPYLLLYSSGTTGKPKGILLPNKSEMDMCKDLASLKVFDPGDRMLIVLPMFHSNALCVWTYPLAYQGLTLVIRKAFSPDDFWTSLLDYSITHVLAVPTMYNYVLATQDPSKIDASRFKLKFTMTGAAPFAEELHDAFLKKFGLEILEGYGLTECAGMSTGNLNVPNKLGSIGVPLPSQQIKIMDANNNIMPVGVNGEICIKGNAILLGYLNQPEATKETIKDGWLHTGDAGYMDEEGYIYMVGRIKEMINRGGENIYPREIESVLENHPQVAAVAVVGVPDPALGERVKACIISRLGETVDPQEIKDFLKDKLAKYKIPDFVEFYTEFPTNSTGKVLKYQMQNLPQG